MTKFFRHQTIVKTFDDPVHFKNPALGRQAVEKFGHSCLEFPIFPFFNFHLLAKDAWVKFFDAVFFSISNFNDLLRLEESLPIT